jgi:hypothetical protein
METCIYNIAEICWGKKEPRPGLFITPTWCQKSDNLIYSPIHQVFPGANTAVTGVLGGRWRTGRWEPWGGRARGWDRMLSFSRTTTSWKTWKVCSATSWSNQHFFLTEKNTSFFRQLAPLLPCLTLVRRWEGPLLFWWHCSHIHLGAGPQSRPLSLIIIIL